MDRTEQKREHKAEGADWTNLCKNVLPLLLIIQIHSHSAIVVFRLQVCGLDHINPNQTLLRTTIWQLSELTWRRSYTWVIWQRVHLE